MPLPTHLDSLPDRIGQAAGESLHLATIAETVCAGLRMALDVQACHIVLAAADGRADLPEPGPAPIMRVPLLDDGMALGSLVVQGPPGTRYTPAARELAEQVAARVVPAVRNALRYQRAREEETRYRTLLEEAADAVLVVDLDGQLVEVNQAAADLLGYDRADLMIRTLADIVKPGDRDDLLQRFRRRVFSGAQRFDYYLLRRDGSSVHVELRATVVQIAGKSLCQAICRDLTDRDALQAAHAREHALYMASVRSLAATVDARDAYTHSHSQQVAFYCRRIAAELDLSAEMAETVELAGLLHDIGKIAVPDAILQKPGRLTPDEWAIMRAHAAKGADILAAGAGSALAGIQPMVRGHHERWDGGGYPDGLAGDEIPLGAAIIGVADAFDTMTTARPYKPAMPLKSALAEVERSAGRQFHPDVAAAFLRAVAADEAAEAAYLDAIVRGSEPGASAIPRLAATLAPPPGTPITPVSLTYQEQQRLAAHMRALYEISRGFPNESDESDVLIAAAQLARDYFGAEAVYLFELQNGRGERLAAGQGGPRAVMRLYARWGWEVAAGFQPFAFQAGDAMVALSEVVAADQPVAIPDVRGLANLPLREVLTARGWRSCIYIPLRAGGEPIGGLGIAYISAYRPFTAHDMELAGALGSSAARALAGVLLHQAERLMRLQLAALQTGNGELERRNRDLSAITQIAQGLAAILDLDSLCLHIVQVLSDTFGYRLVGIALRDKEGAKMRTWVAGETLPAELGYWDSQLGVTGRVIRTRQAALVRDVTSDPDYRVISADIRSEICVPLLNADQLIGVLNVESDAPTPLDDGDLRLLTTLAPQITIAVENARLFAAARRQATQLSLVNRIAHEISGLAATDLRTLLHNSAALLQRELGYSNVSIMMLDPEAEELVCHASVGEYAHIIYRDYRQPVALGMIGWVARNGAPLVANDVREEPAFIQVSSEETPAAEAVMPLIYAGEVLGVLDAESNHHDVFGPADVQMLETLADQLAFAIAYARHARP